LAGDRVEGDETRVSIGAEIRHRLTATRFPLNDSGMDVAQIQSEVRRLPARQRKKLTMWMVAEYPAFSVDRLMRKATRAARTGAWKPEPPTAENFPKGKTLEHALSVAGQLGLRK
jgi:hypothetical protein